MVVGDSLVITKVMRLLLQFFFTILKDVQGVYHDMHVRLQDKNNLQEFSLSVHNVGHRDQTQHLRSKHLYSLSHLSIS